MKTLEEQISEVLTAQGPVIALEGPDEGLPNIGAQRVPIHDIGKAQWQDFVTGLIVRSSMVVV